MKYTIDINQPDNPPPPAAIVDLDSALVRNAFLNHVKQGPLFRNANGRLQSTSNMTVNSIPCTKGRILFPINWMAPSYIDNALQTYLRPIDPNGHSQIRLGAPELDQTTWTKPDTTYIWRATLNMPSSSPWNEIAWVLPMQGHPGSYGPDWATPHTRPPAIALYMKRDHWQLWVRGSNQPKPTQYTHNTKSIDHPFIPGTQNIEISFRCNPLGDDSFVKCIINDVFLAEFKQPVGLNHSALGPNKPALNLAMGYYGTKPSNILNLTYVKILKTSLNQA